MTDEELGEVLRALYRQRSEYEEDADAIRALFPRPVVRQDVPSVEDIRRRMYETAYGGAGAITHYVGHHCAHVAHAMMLALQKPPATEARTMIQGMTADDMDAEMRKLFPTWNTVATAAAANFFYRLANTPAPDPDAEAKRLADAFRSSGDHDYPRWNAMVEGERNGWRAVAAAKGER